VVEELREPFPSITAVDIPTYLRELTPVLLRLDTRFTNHGFDGTHFTTLQSVFQAGTAVLVDAHGVPRVRGYCGSPITAPIALAGAPRTVGTPWPGYRSAALAAVQPSTVTITNFVLVDVVTGQAFNRPAATTGTNDALRGLAHIAAATASVASPSELKCHRFLSNRLYRNGFVGLIPTMVHGVGVVKSLGGRALSGVEGSPCFSQTDFRLTHVRSTFRWAKTHRSLWLVRMVICGDLYTPGQKAFVASGFVTLQQREQPWHATVRGDPRRAQAWLPHRGSVTFGFAMCASACLTLVVATPAHIY